MGADALAGAVMLPPPAAMRPPPLLLRYWAAPGGGGKELYIIVATPLSLKKSFVQKVFGLNPVKKEFGLTLHTREARGVAKIQWAAIEAAHQKISEKELSWITVGGRRIELLAFPMSRECSTTELTAHQNS